MVCRQFLTSHTSSFVFWYFVSWLVMGFQFCSVRCLLKQYRVLLGIRKILRGNCKGRTSWKNFRGSWKGIRSSLSLSFFIFLFLSWSSFFLPFVFSTFWGRPFRDLSFPSDQRRSPHYDFVHSWRLDSALTLCGAVALGRDVRCRLAQFAYISLRKIIEITEVTEVTEKHC